MSEQVYYIGAQQYCEGYTLDEALEKLEDKDFRAELISFIKSFPQSVLSSVEQVRQGSSYLYPYDTWLYFYGNAQSYAKLWIRMLADDYEAAEVKLGYAWVRFQWSDLTCDSDVEIEVSDTIESPQPRLSERFLLLMERVLGGERVTVL